MRGLPAVGRIRNRAVQAVQFEYGLFEVVVGKALVFLVVDEIIPNLVQYPRQVGGLHECVAFDPLRPFVFAVGGFAVIQQQAGDVGFVALRQFVAQAAVALLVIHWGGGRGVCGRGARFFLRRVRQGGQVFGGAVEAVAVFGFQAADFRVFFHNQGGHPVDQPAVERGQLEEIQFGTLFAGEGADLSLQVGAAVRFAQHGFDPVQQVQHFLVRLGAGDVFLRAPAPINLHGRRAGRGVC